MAQSLRTRLWSQLDIVVPLRYPPFATLGGFALFFIAYLEYAALAGGSTGTFGFYDTATLPFEELHIARALQVILIVVAAVFWGAYRGFTFSPFYRPGYFTFLDTSPWQFGKPLPLGPPYPSLRDAVVIGSLSFLVARGYLHGWALPLVAAVVAFAIPTLVMLYAVGLTGWFFLLAFWLTSYPVTDGGHLRVLGWLALNVTLLIFVVRASLESFPWREQGRRQWRFPNQWWKEDLSVLFRRRGSEWKYAIRDAGWPLGPLSPLASGGTGPNGRTLAWSLLAGWSAMMFTPTGVQSTGMLNTYVLFWAFGLTGFGMMRSIALLSKSASPIGLLGRIFTLRWIMPRYDVVILPALIGCAQIIALTRVPSLSDFNALPFLVGLYVAITTAAIAYVPPHTRNWWLTGRYKSVPRDNRVTKI